MIKIIVVIIMKRQAKTMMDYFEPKVPKINTSNGDSCENVSEKQQNMTLVSICNIYDSIH